MVRFLFLFVVSATLFGTGSAGATAVPDPVRSAGLLPVPVEIRIAPYGDVFIDGEKVASNATLARVFVAPGSHVLRVQNPYSKVHSQPLLLPDQDDATEVRVRLEPLPARLIVQLNVDATVSLNGTGIGKRRKGDASLILIPISSWRGLEEVEVVASRPGYVSEVLRLRVKAGEVETRRMVLTPIRNAPSQIQTAIRLNLSPGGLRQR